MGVNAAIGVAVSVAVAGGVRLLVAAREERGLFNGAFDRSGVPIYFGQAEGRKVVED